MLTWRDVLPAELSGVSRSVVNVPYHLQGMLSTWSGSG